MKAGLMRLALAAAHHDSAELDAADLATLCLAVQMGVLDTLTPTERWGLL
ncbi:MAG: hypothetical protein RLY71_4294, partial [Pseudomonadota bacterium]